MNIKPETFFVKDDGIFPNSHLPVLYFPQILNLPRLFAGGAVRNLFKKNNWGNNWKAGIYTYHHYHSICHEVLGFIKGETLLLLGGESGVTIFVEKGDVLVIPAGVAHINLGKEKDITCIGGYEGGRNYDMKYGEPGERKKADNNIQSVPLPETDPVTGDTQGLPEIWNEKSNNG
ncbi:MAG: cupin [Chitinophagaceae bacterium]